nr:salivary glue protein Sgs-3-like [Parasteatoda tepidariorum]
MAGEGDFFYNVTKLCNIYLIKNETIIFFINLGETTVGTTPIPTTPEPTTTTCTPPTTPQPTTTPPTTTQPTTTPPTTTQPTTTPLTTTQPTTIPPTTIQPTTTPPTTAQPTTPTPKPTGPPETDCDEDDLDCIIKETGDISVWFECPEAIGAYRHPSSNKLFIFCKNWKPLVKKCGQKSVYSEQMRTCVRP